MSRQSGEREIPSRTFKAGDVIFQEGDDAKSEAFLVHEGKVEIRKQFAAESRLLGVLGKGQLLGELALFRNAPRSATAIAIEPVTLFLIPAHRLDTLMRVNPLLAMAIVRDLSGRMLAAEERAREAEKRASEAETRASEAEKRTLQIGPAKVGWDQQDSLRALQSLLGKALETVQAMTSAVDEQRLRGETQQRMDDAEPRAREAEGGSEGQKG